MASRHTRRGRRAASLEDHVERAGHAALTAAWTALVRGTGAVLRWLVARGRAVWRRFRALSPRGKLAAVGVAAALGAIVTAVAAARELYVSDDVEALARVIHSECGVCSHQQRLHIAWATRNLALSRSQTIPSMVCSPCGPQQAGRPVSSRLAADDRDRALARYVLGAPALADPTDGARHFVNPQLQNYLAENSDRPGYRGKPYAEVERRWREAYGWEPYYRLGPDLELWGPVRERRR
jgi:hypothetical protein